MLRRRKPLAVVSAAALVTVAATVAVAASVSQGPSSSHSPYVLPAPGQDDVKVVSILTVGDNVPGTDADGPGYQMVGIPDGLGAFRGTGEPGNDGDGVNGVRKGNTFTVLMNHELPQSAGIVRDHGATGSFVSKWTIDSRTLQVLRGEDLIEQVVLAPGGVYAAPAKGVPIGRLCSAYLAEEAEMYNKRTQNGYRGAIFFSGEEVGHEGRAFAHLLDGTSYELPWLGKMSWENLIVQPGTGDRTVVVGMDDSTPGQVYVYIGEKRKTGSPVERAGLVGGKLYGVAVDGFPVEPETGIPSGTPFRLIEITNPQSRTGSDIEAFSLASPITEWKRPEDGQFDPSSPSDYYWVTTDRPEPAGSSRLWRFNFDALQNASSGPVGTVDMLLSGDEGQEMLDNMTVDRFGRVLMQEDPGGDVDALGARIWSYEIASGDLDWVAYQKQQHGPEPGPAYDAYATSDEETSGIIPADDILGKGWYLLDSQIHQDRVFKTPYDAQKLVEKGQLLALYYPVD